MHIKCKVTFTLPELNPTAHVEHTIHITNNLSRYGMILGRDILQELGIDLDFKENNITWGDYQADMKSADITLAEHLANIEVMKTVEENMANILDGKYHLTEGCSQLMLHLRIQQ
eukprot:3985506-Ditylum_brightwellii.AAC.3